MLGNMLISKIALLFYPSQPLLQVPPQPLKSSLSHTLIPYFLTASNTKTAKPNTSARSGTSSTGKRLRNASDEKCRAISQKLDIAIKFDEFKSENKLLAVSFIPISLHLVKI